MSVLLSYCLAQLDANMSWLDRVREWGTVKVGVSKKVVFTKISAHVSVSNKSIF
jgi:hypothetical protein